MNHYKHPKTGDVAACDVFEPAKDTEYLDPVTNEKRVMLAVKSESEKLHDSLIERGYKLMSFEQFTKWKAERDEAVQNTPEALAAKAKADKLKALDKITVTTKNGNTFDGNDAARNNMLSAIAASEFTGQKETYWRMSDNSTALVSVDEVREALALSIGRAGEVYLGKAGA